MIRFQPIIQQLKKQILVMVVPVDSLAFVALVDYMIQCIFVLHS